MCSKMAIVGKSKIMRDIYGIVEKIAPVDVNVLISGEVGCGKETLARLIHNISGRLGNFGIFSPASVLLNDITDNEIDATLESAFLSCKDGTIFIDDVADASTALQNRLTSVLNLKNSIYSRVRVIASTCRDIYELARNGRFRQDLCDLISVVSIELPPLRQRQDDIAELTDIFLKKYSENKKLSEEALRILMKYDWPGNVRELENALIHAAAFAKGTEICQASLPAKLRRKNTATASKSTIKDELYKLAKGLIESGEHLENTKPYEEYIKIAEAPLLQAVMDMCDNNKSLAANRLKINRNTLNKKLQEHGIRQE